MLFANTIPDWNDQSGQGLAAWWNTMAELGVAFHPDDQPETIVFKESGKSCFTVAACRKLDIIIRDMLQIHGDAVYSAGQTAIMRQLGWEESPDKNEWVKAS